MKTFIAPVIHAFWRPISASPFTSINQSNLISLFILLLTFNDDLQKRVRLIDELAKLGTRTFYPQMILAFSFSQLDYDPRHYPIDVTTGRQRYLNVGHLSSYESSLPSVVFCTCSSILFLASYNPAEPESPPHLCLACKLSLLAPIG